MRGLMPGLNRAFAAIVLMAASPVAADGVERWDAHIAEASARFAIPSEWIERVMRAESAGRTQLDGRPITSRAGAMGLMQLMPGTWKEMRARLGLGSDPHLPRDNIFAGTFYLRLMYDRFGYPGLFGAYNAGPARYSAYLAGRATLPGETRAYLASVAGEVGPPASAQLSPSPAMPADSRVVHESAPIFFALGRDRSRPTDDDLDDDGDNKPVSNGLIFDGVRPAQR